MAEKLKNANWKCLFPRATSQVAACRHLATAARGEYPALWGVSNLMLRCLRRGFWLCLALVVFLIGGCAGRKEIILYETEAVPEDNNFGLSAFFEEGNIVITELSEETILNTIPIKFDEYRIFLSMLDEKTGYLLYCSTPGAGQMMKHLYFTEDRWDSYAEADISGKLDGYPTSLSAMSVENLFIGTQMRSNGFLFETTDGGKNWVSFTVDGSVKDCQNGYAPIADKESGMMYVLLKCGESYLLYQLNDVWEKAGSFSLNALVEEFFVSNGELYIIDNTGKQYQIEGDF